MSLKSLLTSECTLQAETYTTNDFGEEIRGFTDPVSVKCRLNSLGRGNPNDLQLGQIIEENQYVLYVGPDTTITTAHKVTLGGSEYKVNHVRPLEDGRGRVSHLQCYLQENV